MLFYHEDVESNFSEQTNYDDHTTFILTKSTDSKIENLVEYSYIPESTEINES